MPAPLRTAFLGCGFITGVHSRALSKLLGRKGVISFESNGALALVRGRGLLRLVFPGFRDIRGYRAKYRDFARSIRDGQAPEMSLERAVEDQRLMDQIYASLGPSPASHHTPDPVAGPIGQ